MDLFRSLDIVVFSLKIISKNFKTTKLKIAKVLDYGLKLGCWSGLLKLQNPSLKLIEIYMVK